MVRWSMSISESVEGSDREDGAEGSIMIEPRELEVRTLLGSVGRVNRVEV
jgi:hypothetical protein